MKRTTSANNVNNRFVDGPPGTIVSANWLNNVQEEICYVIEQNDIALDAGSQTQLHAAINNMVQEVEYQGFAGGSAASPSIYHSGDENCGIFFPGNDIVAISTAGSERVRVDTSGNVGIGTSSPATFNSKLVVADGVVGGYSFMSIVNNSTDQFLKLGINSNNAQIAWDDGDGLNMGTMTNTNSNAIDNIYMRIDSSGNVGIGTASPNSYAGYTSLTLNNATTGGLIDFEYNGTILGEIFNNTSSFNIAALSTYPLIFKTNSTERIRIDSSGNVGIGIAPSYRFHCVNDSDSETIFMFNNPNAGSSAISTLYNCADGNEFRIRVYGDGTATPNKTEFYNNSASSYFTFHTGGASERMRIDASGRIATGGETSPDVDGGGLCLNHGDNDGNVLTFKNSDVAHGVTDLAETDTYGYFDKYNDSFGGCQLTGFGDSTSPYGVVIYGVSATATATTSGVANASVMIKGAVKSGTNVTSLAAGDNLAVMINNTNTTHIFKGDGDIYTDTDQTAGLAGTYADAEDDILLAEAARYKLGHKKWSTKIMEKSGKRLEELGIIQEGMMSYKGIQALNLGSIGQLWNMIRHMSKELGYTETQLLEMAKNYN